MLNAKLFAKQEDVQLMKDMGMDAYRFSISWTRIFPNGTGQINQAGIDHYHSLIDALLSKGIEPYVTLHWDLPQALQNGFLNPQIMVKHWITFNEPHTVATQAYDLGVHAPGRCSSMLSCKAGNSSTEPYIVAHQIILSHTTAADIYRESIYGKME
ncbi:hypothetical protein GBA52_002825 [Prunus armeniaca]|nr:hypothetical protein GBA52_002825 [Prunus armeniaca]